ALFTFEYIITLRQEVSVVWKRKWTPATWLFILNRYVAVLFIIFDAYPATNEEFLIIYPRRVVSLATRLSAILVDIIVLVATWTKSWTSYKEGTRIGLEVPIASLLFRDGTVTGVTLFAHTDLRFRDHILLVSFIVRSVAGNI
ncbi:hypothetical protein BDW22DRAFT_1330589, partial [Trametopsis cervina]